MIPNSEQLESHNKQKQIYQGKKKSSFYQLLFFSVPSKINYLETCTNKL